MAESFGDLMHSFDFKSTSHATPPRHSRQPHFRVAQGSSSSAAGILSSSTCSAVACWLQYLGLPQSRLHPTVSCGSSPISSSYSGLWISGFARIAADSVVIVLLMLLRRLESSSPAVSSRLICSTPRWTTGQLWPLVFRLGVWGCDCYVLPSLMTIVSILGVWTASSSGSGISSIPGSGYERACISPSSV